MLLLCYLIHIDTQVTWSGVADVGDMARKSIQNLYIMSA
jgi:hypothetical protein